VAPVLREGVRGRVRSWSVCRESAENTQNLCNMMKVGCLYLTR